MARKPIEYNRSPNVIREFRAYNYRSEMGRSRVTIDCPFCSTSFHAYVWSISGGGKKCPGCGAMHTSFGQAYPVAGKEPT